MSHVQLLLSASASLILCCGAQATFVPSPQALVIPDGSYNGIPSWDIYVPFGSADDVLLNTTQWDVYISNPSGTFFNASPATDDPLGLIADDWHGMTPLVPGIAALDGYEAWEYDTYLGMDGSPNTQVEPGTAFTPTTITGGAFVLPPSPLAGTDFGGLHLVHVAQITTHYVFFGQFVAVTPSDTPGGVDVQTFYFTNFIPGAGTPALLGLAGLATSRRRRV